MSDKAKAISSLAFSLIGWLVLAGGFLYRECAPSGDEFSSFVKAVLFALIVYAAAALHLFNGIYCTIFLLRKTMNKIIFLLSLLSSLGFFVVWIMN